MLSGSDLTSGLKSLGLVSHYVIAHASLKAFGPIEGGADALLDALLESTRGLIMPAFTYKTMLNPETGPANNGITYGAQQDLNKMAEPFHPDMPVDPMMGIVPEVLRKRSGAKRSSHPIQSFTGIGLDAILNSQTPHNPLGVIGNMADEDGWILLLGVDHAVNTSIHYAERLAGRMQFVRWALMPDRVVECPGFPGDSEGFNAIAPDIQHITRRLDLGGALVKAIQLKGLIEAVVRKIRENPFALLCGRPDCERCNAVRWSENVTPRRRAYRRVD